MAQHTLSVLVENSPGVLARVAGLFSRRGYNIDSLAVGPTEDPKVSRMTIVLNLEGHALDQVSAQLFKLVNVIGIQEMKESETRQRELAFVKVAAERGKLEPLLSGYPIRLQLLLIALIPLSQGSLVASIALPNLYCSRQLELLRLQLSLQLFQLDIQTVRAPICHVQPQL